MKIILLGAPGAGKGTQAEVISSRLGIPIVGTGNIIRDAVRRGTPAGRQAEAYMKAGGLVPDEIVLEMVQQRLSQPDCQNGFIFDGFPRTIAQAEALDKMGVVLDRVVEISVEDETIVERLSGRRVCSGCGVSYHLEHNPPAEEGRCDKCGAGLVEREDDHPDTIRKRLEVYHQETEPLKAYYEHDGRLRVVKGQQEVADTTRLTLDALGVA